MISAGRADGTSQDNVFAGGDINARVETFEVVTINGVRSSGVLNRPKALLPSVPSSETMRSI